MTTSDPFETIKKAFLIGLGATAVTVEKAQALADELIARGEMTQKDASSFTEDLRNRAVKEKDLFESKVKENVDDYLKTAVKNLGFITREEFDAYKASQQTPSSDY